MIDIKDQIRFWKKVNIGAEQECWDWLGAKNQKGYGYFYYKPSGLNIVPSHRIAFLFTYGYLPAFDPYARTQVNHSCDTPGCCNPRHLWLGSQQDNSDDMMEKGRNNQAAGEEHGKAKLTEQEVLTIRAEHNGKRGRNGNGQILADKYGVSRALISRIASGKLWRDV